ncbi:hypothetical protein [Pseudoalteromonas rhizosphaerae]|uniref:hypothetical protein n=1 Tax=Pseudoalteromonas rhizosphaerae TaxID=2518973 RepID=UPI0012308EC2|nr:hypothetical protein [Pseudoalteromonas rhizosphaerae]
MNVINQINKSICILSVTMSAFFLFSNNLLAASMYLLPNGNEVSIELDSVSTVFDSDNGWLLGGYKIINGSNASYVSFIPYNKEPIKYWPLTRGYVSQFFKANNKFYVISSAGDALQIEDDGLTSTGFKVKPKSTVVAEKPYLIACHPRGWAKLSSINTGSCYRLDGTWDIELSWTQINIPPKLCNGNLKVLITTNKDQNWDVITLDTETGKTLTSKKIAKPKHEMSLCEL